MLENRITELENLTEAWVRTLETRLSIVEQQVEAMRLRYQFVATELTKHIACQDAQDDSGETVTKCTTY